MKVFTSILEEDPVTGDLILPLSEEFCKEYDWQSNDVLNMVVKGEAIHITNISWQERHGATG